MSNNERKPCHYLKRLFTVGCTLALASGCVSQTLPQATAFDNPEKALILIEEGAQIDQTWYGRQAIHYAAREQQPEVVIALIEAGADVNATTSVERNSPMHYSAQNGDVNITQTLIDAGAEYDSYNLNSDTPLILAALSGNVATAKLLVETGAEVNKGHNISTPPIAAAAASNTSELVQLLLNNGSNIDGRDRIHNTAASIAAIRDNTDALITLLDAGADPAVQNVFGQGLAHYAAYHGNVDVLRRLADENVDLLAESLSGRTPYHFAVMTDQADAISLLLSVGATPDVVDLTMVDREVTGHGFARYGEYMASVDESGPSREAFLSASQWYQSTSEQYGSEAKKLTKQLWGAFFDDMMSAAVAGALSGAMTGALGSTGSRTVMTGSGDIYRITPVRSVPYQVTDTSDMKVRRKAYREKEKGLKLLATTYLKRSTAE